MLPHRPLLVPGLLALLGAAIAAEPSAVARDAQFVAVKGLIGQGLRLPAERQAAAFAAAGHADPGQWHAKVLRWYLLDEFREGGTAAQIAEIDALQRELDAAKDSLPPAGRQLVDAASGLIRHVNDVARELDPNSPAPIAGPTAWANDRRAKVERGIAQVIASLQRDLPAKIEAAAAFDKANESLFMEGDTESQPYQQASQAAALKWEDALRTFSNAHIALREVITRGQAGWGLDPAPARAAMQALITSHRQALADAVYQWGDLYPPLHGHMGVFMGEGARLGVKDCSADATDEEFAAITGVKADEFKEPVRSQFILLQLKAWNDHLAWHLDMGTPEMLKKAGELIDQITDAYREMPEFGLDAKEAPRARAMAALTITAARIRAAQGDIAGATALLGAVAGAKDNPLRGAAGQWLPALTRGAGSAPAEYGRHVVPAQPTAALSTARALLKESQASTDAAQVRQFLLMAVANLQGGIAGLAGTDQATWTEIAPQLFERLGFACAQLGMPLHAQAAILDGLRQCLTRGADAGAKSSLWRSKDRAFTPAGLHLQRLVRNGLSISLRAAGETRLGAVTALNAQIIAAAEKISPEDTGDNLLLLVIDQLFSSGDYDKAMREADAAAAKRPELGAKMFGVVANGMQRWMDALDKSGATGKRDEVGKDLLRRAEAREAAIATELAKPQPAREALRDKAQIEAARSMVLIQAGRFREVMDRLGPVLTEAPPSDDSIAAQALADLCRATVEFHLATFKEPDLRQPRLVLDTWAAYARSYAAFLKLKPRLTAQAARVERSGGNLSSVFNQVQYLAGVHLAQAKDLAEADRARLVEIEAAAKRAFADLQEPRLSKDSKPDLLWATAQTLWDIGEHERAARVYELFRDVLTAAPALAAFRSGPKAWLDAREAVLGGRQEFRELWRAVRDRLEDARPLKEVWEQGQGLSSLQEKPMDYGAARIAVRALRAAVDGKRTVLGAQHAELVAALDQVEAAATALTQDTVVKTRLATAYREAGRKQEAQALYGQLFDLNPFDPDASAAYVELVLDRVRDGSAPVPQDQLTKARTMAVDNRERSAAGTMGFWLAVIQVGELCAALGDKESIEAIANRLRWVQVNRSDLSRDLVRPGVADGGLADDRRARRPLHPQAVELARRFLGLYQVPGITAKPTFRIDTLGEGAVFVDAGAPAMEEIAVPDRNGDPVRILWPTGTPPPVPAAPTAGPTTAPATP
jgi:tetratricopeptide (TPR) repeat protein